MNILQQLKRRTVRAPISPIDRATIFSIWPRDIHIEKITIEPNKYLIPKGTVDTPGRLVVTPASWWREDHMNDALIEMPEDSVKIARSVVNDYVNSILYTNPECRIGVFFIPGDISVAVLKDKHKEELENARRRQIVWFQRQVEAADVGWSRTNKNPLAISDDAKLAATELKLNKEWMNATNLVEMITCIACGGLRNPLFPICNNCKNIVDRPLAIKVGLLVA